MAERELGKAPLISIVTVCLNAGDDLHATAYSVLNQRFDDYEWLIKDGGSTDGTKRSDWRDARVVWHSSPDSGIWDAMNQALGLVRGEYVCFLNAGDVFEDHGVLADNADFIRKLSGVYLINGDVRKPESRSGVELYPDILSRFYLFGHMICHQCWFLRREEYLSACGFETRETAASDYRLLLRLLLVRRVTYAHAPQVVVRYKGGGASTVPETVRSGSAWGDELRKELFRRPEYAAFRTAYALRYLLKLICYDHVLCYPWRLLQSYRVRRRARLSRGPRAQKA